MARKTKRMKDVSEEEWKLVNEENKLLLDDFLLHIEAEDISPTTIKGYKSDLKIVFNWFRQFAKNKEFYDIKKTDVSRFQSWCIGNEMSPARIRRLRSAMSSLSNYVEKMLDDDYPNFRNIINKIKAPTLSFVREKTVFSEEEVNDLLNILVEKEEYQLACFVAVLAGSGMRKSEVIQCKIDWFFGDINLFEGMYVSPEIRTKGRGKLGKRMKKMVIKDIVDKYLKLWKDEREKLGIDNDSLFVSKINGKYKSASESTVDYWMEKLTKITGVDNYAHCYRHYSATWLKRNGVEIDTIRDFFGHESSETTQIYIDIGSEENLKGMLSFMDKNK
jgi:integrase/recombinase XerD